MLMVGQQNQVAQAHQQQAGDEAERQVMVEGAQVGVIVEGFADKADPCQAQARLVCQPTHG